MPRQMLRASLILIAACHGPSDAPVPVVVALAPPVTVVLPPPDAPTTPTTPTIPPNTILLAPVAMDGPYKSANEACEQAQPCGFTDMTAQGIPSKPATVASCPALRSSDFLDPNSVDPNPTGLGIDMAQLSHTAKGMELRIGSQSCAEPKGLRGEEDIYYMFVERADGWWRSEPLWKWSYNDKYGDGTMRVRWNDAKPGRTFVGVMAGENDLVCMKQGSQSSTLEMMIRVESGTKTPIVFAPLVVGERFSVQPMQDLAGENCKASKSATEMDEHWSSDDDLELTGPGAWRGLRTDGGILEIRFTDDDQPSTAGHYRFTR